jgi:hypothetical protein
MLRRFLYLLSILAFLGASLAPLTRGVGVQAAAAPTPSATADATPEPSDTIWFILSPKGKENGDYFDVTLEAGKTATLTATIGNGSSVPVKAITYAADAYSDLNGGFALKAAGSEPTGTTTWLDFPSQTIDFDAKQAIDQQFTVTVPEGTPPGQYIAGIAVETADAQAIAGDSPLSQKMRLATAVFITVPGPTTPEFAVSDLALVVDPQGTSLTGLVTNTGNVRVRPEGTVTIADAQGATVVEAPIKMGSVYAHDETHFLVTLPNPIPEGSYLANAKFEDPDTGATATLDNAAVTAAAPVAPSPLSVSAITLTPMPSADNVVFVQVGATIANTGTPVAGGEVTLQVFRDGKQVDDHVLATSLTIPTGDTAVDQPYIPASGAWESGTYTFQITLTTTDPATGAKTIVGTYPSDQSLVIP